jgi:hypothetical protein
MGRRTNFKEVWKKAVEKYSPKKATKVNEVSIRYQQKLEEIQKANEKSRAGKEEAPDSKLNSTMTKGFTKPGEEEERIKFVSIIDQKPVKPSYLELISLKNFAKKEQEAQRAQFKDNYQEPQKQESNDQKQSGISQIDWFKMLQKNLEDELR